jgi:hypothetical protein
MSLLGYVFAPVVRPIRKYRDQHSRDFVLKRFPKDSIGAEIGVWKGGFSQQILNVVKPRRLHLIDPWAYQDGREFSRALYGGVQGEDQKRMDGVYRSVVERFGWFITHEIVDINRGKSSEILESFPDGYFDWVYVDGDHRYEGVLLDLTLAHQKVKAGGIVAGDDYTNVNAWWKDGVPKAVDEVIRRGLYSPIEIRKNQFVLAAQKVALEGKELKERIRSAAIAKVVARSSEIPVRRTS